MRIEETIKNIVNELKKEVNFTIFCGKDDTKVVIDTGENFINDYFTLDHNETDFERIKKDLKEKDIVFSKDILTALETLFLLIRDNEKISMINYYNIEPNVVYISSKVKIHNKGSIKNEEIIKNIIKDLIKENVTGLTIFCSENGIAKINIDTNHSYNYVDYNFILDYDKSDFERIKSGLKKNNIVFSEKVINWLEELFLLIRDGNEINMIRYHGSEEIRFFNRIKL